MIDFAIEAQRAGEKSPFDAMYEACMVRFAADHDDHHGGVMARYPCAGLGCGCGIAPAGLAVSDGLILSQLLTLYITAGDLPVLEEAA